MQMYGELIYEVTWVVPILVNNEEYIYIYICVCVCVCVCMYIKV